MSTETCLPPNSEMVPSSHAKCTTILRVAHALYRTDPRIAYLCVHGALAESKKIDPLAVLSEVAIFNMSLRFWIQRNDETSEQGKFQPHIDLPPLKSFYLDYYEKNVMDVIKIIGNQYTILKEIESSACTAAYRAIDAAIPAREDNRSSRGRNDSFIQHACKTAGVLFRVLELLSKDVQLPSEFLEADTDVKQLAKIFRPYNLFPLYIGGEYSMKRLPELQAAITALSFPWCTTLPMRFDANPSPARDREDLPAKSPILEHKTSGMPAGFGISPRVPKLSLFLCSVYFLLFSVLIVILII